MFLFIRVIREIRGNLPELVKLRVINFCVFGVLLLFAAFPQTLDGEMITNGPAVYTVTNHPLPTNPLIHQSTNPVFDRFLPSSLNNLIWTNFIAHTNGRVTQIWSVRT